MASRDSNSFTLVHFYLVYFPAQLSAGDAVPINGISESPSGWALVSRGGSESRTYKTTGHPRAPWEGPLKRSGWAPTPSYDNVPFIPEMPLYLRWA